MVVPVTWKIEAEAEREVLEKDEQVVMVDETCLDRTCRKTDEDELFTDENRKRYKQEREEVDTRVGEIRANIVEEKVVFFRTLSQGTAFGMGRSM